MEVYTVVMSNDEGHFIIADRYTHSEICDVINTYKQKGFKKDKPIIVTKVTNEYEILLKERVMNYEN